MLWFLFPLVCMALPRLQILTQIAFSFFSEEEVDWAVIETGLGGRLDATNIIAAPRCTVITSIGEEDDRKQAGKKPLSSSLPSFLLHASSLVSSWTNFQSMTKEAY